jgi:hypothetical protein
MATTVTNIALGPAKQKKRYTVHDAAFATTADIAGVVVGDNEQVVVTGINATVISGSGSFKFSITDEDDNEYYATVDYIAVGTPNRVTPSMQYSVADSPVILPKGKNLKLTISGGTWAVHLNVVVLERSSIG